VLRGQVLPSDNDSHKMPPQNDDSGLAVKMLFR
jgi:hypothetical protein